MISWITPQLAIGEYSDAINPDLITQEKIGTILFLDSAEKFREILLAQRNNHVFLKHAPVVVDYNENEDIVWVDNKFSFSDDLNEQMQELLNFAYCELSSIQFGSNYTERTLVCCVAGMDRSPFVVAKYLVEKQKSLWIDEKGQFYGCEGKRTFYMFKTMADAYSYIKLRRSLIVEHYEWLWRHEK